MNLAMVVTLAGRALNEEAPPVVQHICADYQQPYYAFMYWLAKYSDGGLFVELGVEKGRGSACMAAGNPEARVIGMDHTRHEEIADLQRTFRNFTFLERPSLPALETLDLPISILHIDTEHSYAMAQEEFKAYRDKLATGAVVLFDDLHAMNDGVLEYFFSLPYPKFQDDRLHPSCGYGALVYE